jgi:hypothetical protein
VRAILDSKLGIGLACALAVALGAGGVVWMQRPALRPPALAPAPARAASGWDGAIGPGALPAAPAGAPAPFTAGIGEPSLADAGGQLRIDLRLRSTFDGYLNKSTPAQREAGAAQLHAYLTSRLARPALDQAETLADAYLRYLQAEEALRARERFTRPDAAGLTEAQVDQMLAWQQQRAGLRERMLGTAVAQAWFGTDDAGCRTALADWRKMQAPADSPEVNSNELRARRLHGAVLQARRNEQAQSCAGQLMAGLAPGS